MTNSPPNDSTSSRPTWLAELELAEVITLPADPVPPLVKSVTVLHASTDEYTFHYENTGDRVKAWARQGALWGGFWSVVFGGVLAARAWTKHRRTQGAPRQPGTKV